MYRHVYRALTERFGDFIYIGNVINVFMMSSDNSLSYGGVYNVGTGIRTTVKDLIKLMLETFEYAPDKYLIKFSGSTPDDTFGIYADITWMKKI